MSVPRRGAVRVVVEGDRRVESGSRGHWTVTEPPVTTRSEAGAVRVIEGGSFTLPLFTKKAVKPVHGPSSRVRPRPGPASCARYCPGARGSPPRRVSPRSPLPQAGRARIAVHLEVVGQRVTVRIGGRFTCSSGDTVSIHTRGPGSPGSPRGRLVGGVDEEAGRAPAAFGQAVRGLGPPVVARVVREARGCQAVVSAPAGTGSEACLLDPSKVGTVSSSKAYVSSSPSRSREGVTARAASGPGTSTPSAGDEIPGAVGASLPCSRRRSPERRRSGPRARPRRRLSRSTRCCREGLRRRPGRPAPGPGRHRSPRSRCGCTPRPSTPRTRR